MYVFVKVPPYLGIGGYFDEPKTYPYRNMTFCFMLIYPQLKKQKVMLPSPLWAIRESSLLHEHMGGRLRRGGAATVLVRIVFVCMYLIKYKRQISKKQLSTGCVFICIGCDSTFSRRRALHKHQGDAWPFCKGSTTQGDKPRVTTLF